MLSRLHHGRTRCIRMNPGAALSPRYPASAYGMKLAEIKSIHHLYRESTLARNPAAGYFAALAWLVFAGSATNAWAQAWKPDRPVELVVFAAAGGGNDKAARTIQKIWHDHRLLEAIVVNKVGGGGALAYSYVSQKTGDGNTIAIAQAG